MIIGGHQRVTAARRLGYKTLPAVMVDLPIEKARLLNVTLNKAGGEFDTELLARLLADLAPLEDVDLSLSGFSEDELKKLLKNLDARDKRIALSRLISTPRWKPHVRHHAPNMARFGR